MKAVQRGNEIIDRYMDQHDIDMNDAAICIIADVLHAAEAEFLDVETIVRIAQEHLFYERVYKQDRAARNVQYQ